MNMEQHGAEIYLIDDEEGFAYDQTRGDLAEIGNEDVRLSQAFGVLRASIDELADTIEIDGLIKVLQSYIEQLASASTEGEA